MTKPEAPKPPAVGSPRLSEGLGPLAPMEQLLAFCDWERKHNPQPKGKTHIAEWAAAEIERLQREVNCWRTRGRPLRLSDPEMAESVARLKHRLATDKDFARSMLNEAGIVGKDGKLKRQFRA